MGLTWGSSSSWSSLSASCRTSPLGIASTKHRLPRSFVLQILLYMLISIENLKTGWLES